MKMRLDFLNQFGNTECKKYNVINFKIQSLNLQIIYIYREREIFSSGL